MKKTREKTRFDNLVYTIFRPKKFTKENYDEDKEKMISFYNEHGYRDARIVKDSVVPFDDTSVDIYITVEEGKKYYIRDIKWVGNSVYSTAFLDQVLRMKAGDIYDQNELENRLLVDEDAVKNLYYNEGYVFFNALPVEAKIENDSRDVVVIVIGESARSANFSLYGYERDTNPLLEKDSVTTYNAIASATSTTAAVKAILSHKTSGKLYEILPN